jgi:lambda family phage portal protein
VGLLETLGIRARPKAGRAPRVIRGRYDAAQTTSENRRHWAMADSYSADAALIPEVRKTLRERSRYECANNSYAAGMVRTIAEDMIGSGPRLQLQTPDSVANSAIEAAWERWSAAVDLAGKLRIMRMSRARDGEVFAVLTSNPRIRQTAGVSLDLQLIEADQVYSPMGPQISPDPQRNIDGVIVDGDGNVIAYTIAEEHPGSRMPSAMMAKNFRRLRAEQVIHYFRPERPGQHRGLPEITPALPLFAQLRRYTLAVLSAAETAADYAAVIYTDAPAGGEAEAAPDLLPIERRSIAAMPEGWRLEQLKAEQPTTTYAMFKREILSEIARCMSMPYAVAAGDSSNHNYASGRLDHQVYHKAVAVERSVMAATVLDRIFAAWRSEAVLVEDAVPPRFRSVALPHSWMWPGHPHVDPSKEAVAAETRLRSGLTTLADEYAAVGKDWEEQMRQRAREIELAQELGLLNDEDENEVEVDDEDDEA